MKKLLTLSAVALLAASTYGQGLVTFNNRDTASTPNILAPVTLNGALASGTAARIALLGGPNATGVGAVLNFGAPGSTMGNLSLLASPNSGNTWVNFGTGGRAGFAAVGTDSGRVLSNVGFNADAKLQLVAWTGNFTDWSSAFAAALNDPTIQVGASAPWTVHTAADAITFPPVNTGMTPFSMGVIAVPEPSTMALAGLGAAALLIFRRRK